MHKGQRVWLWFDCNCQEHAGGWVWFCGFNSRGKSPSWWGWGGVSVIKTNKYTDTHADKMFIHVQLKSFLLKPILDKVGKKGFAIIVYWKCSRKTSLNGKLSTILHDDTQCTALSGPCWSCPKSRNYSGDAKTHLASPKHTDGAGTSHLTCTSWRPRCQGIMMEGTLCARRC